MTTIKISAVGDILMWRPQIQSGKISENEYSFDYMFNEVKPLLKESDIVMGNLETNLAGRELNYQFINPKTRWPVFNCPDELSQALKNSGFNVLTTANNHCLDKGIDGMKRTLDILDKVGFNHTGTFHSLDDSKKKLIMDVKGIRVGILSYTYGTNLNPIPKDEPWAVNLINNDMLGDIYKMKKRVDLTIVCIHFGREFSRHPNEEQKNWVQQCFEYGADIVLGAHPHVIQPMKIKYVKDIDGIEKERFVIYSLGNFISDIMLNNIHTVSGVILNLSITKSPQGNTSITHIEYIPTWVYRNKTASGTKFIVLPIGKYLQSKDSALPSNALSKMNIVWNNTSSHLGGITR